MPCIISWPGACVYARVHQRTMQRARRVRLAWLYYLALAAYPAPRTRAVDDPLEGYGIPGSRSISRYKHLLKCVCFYLTFTFQILGKDVARGLVPGRPPVRAFIFISQRVQHPNARRCSSTYRSFCCYAVVLPVCKHIRSPRWRIRLSSSRV